MTNKLDEKIAMLNELAHSIEEWAQRGDQGYQFYPSDAREFVRKLQVLTTDIQEAYEDLLLEWKEEMTYYDD